MINCALTSTQLHSPPPSSFQPSLSSCNINRTKISHVIGQFPKFRPINSKLSVLTIDTHSILELLIRNPNLDFWNSDIKSNFGANLDRKSQSCPFGLKIGTHGILRMWILIPTLVFWIFDPKSAFGQLWSEKINTVCFAWNQHTFYFGRDDSKSGVRFSRFRPQIHFWASLGQKSIRCLLSFETVLLFLDVQLVLVLYFKIALHSSAAFHKRFWKYKVPIYVYIYIYIYIHKYIYIQYIYIYIHIYT